MALDARRREIEAGGGPFAEVHKKMRETMNFMNFASAVRPAPLVE